MAFTTKMVIRRSQKHASICFFFFYVLFIFSVCCNGSDTITTDKPLFPNQTIVSNQSIFELAFFTPGDSRNYYICIRYRNMPDLPNSLWVANRNDPIPFSSYNDSVFGMFNGDLALTVKSKRIWTLVGSPTYATEAAILDTGNFVLRNASTVIWQSFDHPSGTWLPGGIIGFRRSVESKLTSWRNGNDPGNGNYSFGLERNGGGELFIKKNGSEITWRGGALVNDLYNFSFISRDDDMYFTYNVYNKSMLVRIMLHSSGQLYHYVWSNARRDWVAAAKQPYDPEFCNIDAKCGPNSICDVNYLPACKCLNGFVPRVQSNWDSLEFSNGCQRVKRLQCDKGKTEFVIVNGTKLPGNAIRRAGDCKFMCLNDCSCNGYAYDNGGECLLFKEDLLDMERLPNTSIGNDFYVRTEYVEVEHSEKGNRKVRVVALVVPVTVAVLISCFCLFYWRRKIKSKESHKDLLQLDLNPNGSENNSGRNNHGENGNYHNELPMFSFSSIVASTDNFSTENKLGEGGFGPVYKGQLHNKQFVAVKRLSKKSEQGLEEFRNETKLIAKLQHRNLVGILGCCIENDEKILVYEYMPNKSLDFFLFEARRKEVLDWRRRAHIIEGIAQGLLYLHHHSRLRIIHRDLKASNILLDAKMNPKISDFGMARIFGGDNSQANTKRIVGTYGYMSPEYALHGIFSEKSDVYSFGVLLLEIVSGKRNSHFYDEVEQLFLIPYAWKLWNDEKMENFMDPSVFDSGTEAEMKRYANVGLLCVQETAADRPYTSTVLSMLSSAIVELPRPKKPAFVRIGTPLQTQTSHKSSTKCSVNEITVSIVQGR